MRKSGLTGDEAYALSKHGKVTEDLGPLKKEVSSLKKDLANVWNGYMAPNKGNVLNDWKMETVIPSDVNVKITDSDDSPSKQINITNTDKTRRGAYIDVGNVFVGNGLLAPAGNYYFHFKCRCNKNNAYTYQSASIDFYEYYNDDLKGSFTVETTAGEIGDKKFYDLVYKLSVTDTTSAFNRIYICSNKNFDYAIKDLYIIKDTDNDDPYFAEIKGLNYCIKKVDESESVKTNLKVGIIGDSLSDPSIHHAEKWHKFLYDNNGYAINCVAVSGSGYFNGSNKSGKSNHQFYNQALRLDNDCDIVLVFGGLNDAGKVKNGDVIIGKKNSTETTTIGGCINKTISNILSTNPLATIGIITPTPWEGLNPMIAEDNEYYNGTIGILNLIKEICDYRSIPCLDLFHESGLRPWIGRFKEEYFVSVDDGTHPNEKGHEKFIYPRIREFLRKLNWQNI